MGPSVTSGENKMKKTRRTQTKTLPVLALTNDQLAKASGGFNPQPDPPGDIPKFQTHG
jgi:hypothetical protein